MMRNVFKPAWSEAEVAVLVQALRAAQIRDLGQLKSALVMTM